MSVFHDYDKNSLERTCHTYVSQEGMRIRNFDCMPSVHSPPSLGNNTIHPYEKKGCQSMVSVVAAGYMVHHGRADDQLKKFSSGYLLDYLL